MELGKNIIKIRKENNLTQDDLADKYFVTRQTISNWENGKSYPDLETLLKISDDFNISLDILLKEDRKMIEKIDTSVKATKKYKNLLIYFIVGVCLLLFFGYKAVMLNKYSYDKVDMDTSTIFNEIVYVNKEEYDGKRINIDNMSIANYFEDYTNANPTSPIKVKRNKDQEVESFYSTSSMTQYIYVLDEESISLAMDNEENELVSTSDSMKKFLDKNEIKSDVDLLMYIKNNYYFKNNIFTFTSNMKRNYTLNAFASLTIIDFNNIALIKGDLSGYIINTKNEAPYTIKEIHILNKDKQYIITLSGEEITNNEFINKLLSTVEFN